MSHQARTDYDQLNTPYLDDSSEAADLDRPAPQSGNTQPTSEADLPRSADRPPEPEAQEQEDPDASTPHSTDEPAQSPKTDEEQIVLAKVRHPKLPQRRGIAPVVEPSGPDRGLSGFLDTLDERARTWWASRKRRREQSRARATKPTGPLAPISEHPGAEAVAAAGSQAKLPTGALELPESRHPEQSSGGQLRRAGGPVARPLPQGPAIAVPLAPELPAAHSAAGQVPAPATVSQSDAQLHAPGPVTDLDAAESHDAVLAPRGASAEETVVIPAYRDDVSPSTVPEASEPAAYSEPVRPPRVRRALDEQRRRDVIVQKAQAIENATATYGAPPSTEFADDEEDLYTYIPPYNLPSRDPDPQPTRVDLYRRIFVSLGALAAVVATMWMLGWILVQPDSPAVLLGNGLQETYANGWYSGEHALLSPDHNFYWLWPLISLGLVVHAGFQWTATQESTPRQRRSGWLVGSASLLTLVATASLHHGLITLMVLVSVPMAVLLLDAIRQFNLYTARSTLERRLTDGIVGLFFGFSLVHAISSVSVWLTAQGWDIPGIPALLWAGIGLFICVWTAAFYSMTERGRITIALSLGWGMFWLIFPRLLAEVTSVWVAIGAAMGAFIVILCTQSRRHRINHAERRAAMGRPLEDII